MMFKNLPRILFLILFFLGTQVFAVGQTTENFPTNGGMALWTNLSSGCSASLFAFSGYNKESNALVITNGHCSGSSGFLETFEVVIDKEPSEDIKIYLYSSGDQPTLVGYVAPKRLLYATMYQRDLAIYQLEETYAALESVNVHPLTLSPSPELNIGQTYQLPSSYWENTYSCEAVSSVNYLYEDTWRWSNVTRLSPENCLLKGGMSGAPLLNEQNEIVALVNTGYTGGEPCSLNNPCEYEEQDVLQSEAKTYPDAGYSVSLSGLYSCLDENGDFNALIETCPLPK